MVLYIYEQQAAAWVLWLDIIECDDLLITAHLYGRNVGAAGVAIVVIAVGCRPVTMLTTHCGT